MRFLDLSPSSQDCLKHLHHLGGRSTTGKLAEHLCLAPASVNSMLKKLKQCGLVEQLPYGPVSLTPAGLQLAWDLLRHHQLLVLYLHRVLGYSPEEAHQEAETLEHHISHKLEHQLYERLGRPLLDLEGLPIPPTRFTQRSTTP
ncbi:metal-dependent transcriptional regulator [Deinococcus roseus]|uniref:Manganese transport regulator n=1 Tax=Deinococcus roseus TaxID=392414 RepID=A0ABQ2D1U2_9DEIO|nr:metal-dependent transcriptional regulator [Deinococcus roseus]GGJ42354.1 hypothetical protein GCM10008938_30610 [Deinococcus roseus]